MMVVDQASRKAVSLTTMGDSLMVIDLVPADVATSTNNGQVSTFSTAQQANSPGAAYIEGSITSLTGTLPTVVMSLQWSPDGVTWLTLPGALTVAATTVQKMYLYVGRGLTGVTNQVVGMALPPRWRVQYILGGTSTVASIITTVVKV